MWSIEKMTQDEDQESPTTSESEKPRIKVKNNEKAEDEKLEEIGYKLGTRGHVCQTKVIEEIEKLEEEQKALDEDYNRIQRTVEETSTETSGSQVLNLAEGYEEILMRQIRLEQRKVSVYERAYTEELLLRMRPVDFLRRHEKIRFGKVNEITETGESEKLTVPRTPEELVTRDRAKEDLPWYWRADDAERIPRTPPYEAIYPQRTSSSSKEKEEIPNESSTGIESPQAKKARTPPKDSEEDIQRRLQEWKDAAEADRKLAESWKPPEITEEGQRQAEEAFRRGEQ
jgi:hypothetical protein